MLIHIQTKPKNGVLLFMEIERVESNNRATHCVSNRFADPDPGVLVGVYLWNMVGSGSGLSIEI